MTDATKSRILVVDDTPAGITAVEGMLANEGGSDGLYRDFPIYRHDGRKVR